VGTGVPIVPAGKEPGIVLTGSMPAVKVIVPGLLGFPVAVAVISP
jgi:hypothetical protein